MSHARRTRIGIIIGSTRPDPGDDGAGVPRKGAAVGKWVYELASARRDAEYTLVDLRDIDLPLFDEPFPPLLADYRKPHTRAWAQQVDSYDGFVFVTPEYNRSTCASLKNAIDFLHAEWANKAAGFVSYGGQGGLYAVDHLRGMLAGLEVATVAASVSLSLYTDFVELQDFRPHAHQAEAVDRMLDQLVTWAGALQPLRPPPESNAERVEQPVAAGAAGANGPWVGRG